MRKSLVMVNADGSSPRLRALLEAVCAFLCRRPMVTLVQSSVNARINAVLAEHGSCDGVFVA